MLSLRPRAPAASASALTSSPVSVLPTSALNQSCRSKSRDEFICQVADDFPSNLLQSTDPPIDAVGLLSNGTMSKTLLSCNTPKVSKSGLECVLCVEVFPVTMNHCVPDWDTAGREMDVIWEPTDLFSPSKGKWDSGHARKSDLGFVPENDFEELCWEDGQLLVVMQGLNSKGNIKNRSCWQVNAGDTAPLTSGIQTTVIDSTFDTLGTAELMDPSTLNMHSQEDELLSWLQHPPEDLVDKLVIPSDTISSSTPLVNGEITFPNDLTHRNIRRNLAFSEDLSNRSVSKNVRSDTLVTFPMNTLNKLGQDNHGVINQQIQVNTLAGCSLIPSANMRSKEPCKPGLMTARLDMPPPQMHSATVGVPCSSPMRKTSSGAMNFSNFSRPAVTFKVNLHSLGMANGPSGAERLKQMDRVAVDASKSESIDSTTKHLRLIAPRRVGVELPVPTISQSAGASNIHNPVQSFSLQRESEQDASATGAGNGCSGNGVQSDGWNSSLISSTTFGLDGSTEVLEVAELSDTSSSGGSEDSEDVDGKRGAGGRKRKSADEDLEIQSKVESEAIGNKKHAMDGGNNIKKSRAAENHNQSERRRRDRISEKMKALQALVPNSYKTDKASMLEEAISYIKALKAQIQMMSFRSGMYFSPMFMPQGMQPVQMAAWPHMGMGMGMGMNMGMGMSAGMGMFDMSMAMAAAAPRQFSPMLPFPGAIIPAVQTAASAALDSARLVHGVAGHVVPLAAPQMVVPARPGVPIVSTCDSSPTLNVVSPKIFPASQQQRPVQCSNPQVGWMGENSTNLSYPHQFLQPTAFMTGFGSLQQQ